MRTFTVRRTALAATVMAAALVTTACGGGETGKAPSAEASGKGPSATSTVSPAPSAAQSGTGAADSGGKESAGGANSGTSAGGNGGTGTSGKQSTGGTKQPGGGTQAKVVTCTGDNTRVVVTRPARPINHLLLTATNKGSAACDLYRAPLLRFDDEQSATAIDSSTQQHSVIRLAPGQSAYASVILVGERAGEEANGRTTSRLGVHFDSRDASGSVGRPATPTLPADTYKTDDAKVTHWVNSLDEALGY